MKNITYLDMMTESVSALTSVIRNFKNAADDPKAVELNSEPYLVVAYSTDTFRKLFENAPEAIRESANEAVTEAMDNLYLHKCMVEAEEGVMGASNVRYDFYKYSHNAHILHMWTHELYQEACTAVERWS